MDFLQHSDSPYINYLSLFWGKAFTTFVLVLVFFSADSFHLDLFTIIYSIVTPFTCNIVCTSIVFSFVPYITFFLYPVLLSAYLWFVIHSQPIKQVSLLPDFRSSFTYNIHVFLPCNIILHMQALHNSLFLFSSGVDPWAISSFLDSSCSNLSTPTFTTKSFKQKEQKSTSMKHLNCISLLFLLIIPMNP